MPGTKASTMPASSSRIAGAILVRRANSAVPASTASRIRKIWNLASTAVNPLARSICPGRRRRQCLVFRVITIRLRDDLPAIPELHRHQIVGEIARRQLAAHLDEGGGFVRAVDGDDEILARLALGLGRGPLPDPALPIRHGEDFQFALLDPAQVGGGMENLAELVGIALIERVEIMLDHGFDGGTVVRHLGGTPCLFRSSFRGARPGMTAGVVTSRTRPCRRPACRTAYRLPRPGRGSSDG